MRGSFSRVREGGPSSQPLSRSSARPGQGCSPWLGLVRYANASGSGLPGLPVFGRASRFRRHSPPRFHRDGHRRHLGGTGRCSLRPRQPHVRGGAQGQGVDRRERGAGARALHQNRRRGRGLARLRPAGLRPAPELRGQRLRLPALRRRHPPPAHRRRPRERLRPPPEPLFRRLDRPDHPLYRRPCHRPQDDHPGEPFRAPGRDGEHGLSRRAQFARRGLARLRHGRLPDGHSRRRGLLRPPRRWQRRRHVFPARLRLRDLRRRPEHRRPALAIPGLAVRQDAPPGSRDRRRLAEQPVLGSRPPPVGPVAHLGAGPAQSLPVQPEAGFRKPRPDRRQPGNLLPGGRGLELDGGAST